MEPKNKEERRSAFGKFLLLFVVCIGLVLTLAFFSVRVPFSENEKLISEKKKVEKEKEFSDRFTTKMMGISTMLDSINKENIPEQTVIILEGRIVNEINDLDLMVQNALDINNKNLYNYTIHNFSDMLQDSKEIRKKINKDADATKLEAELEKAKEEANGWYKAYNDCNRVK